MKASDIPVKTPKGEREIEERAHKMSWKTRALLVSIRGHKTVDQLAYLFKTPQALADAIDELVTTGLIEVLPAHVVLPGLDQSAGASPLQQARQLLNETAVGSVGLWGGISALRFTLQLERCYSASELRAVLPQYRRLVENKSGEAFVNAVLQRVDELLSEDGNNET